ncbi:unnamed protein product [Allacma fusca]|uniref:Uncharacterized protein n=1 Tax=Allacma fusca TaxID=39272 RepID=A0A8J2LDD2_9HEXA|nr:unnamed protein product [Allacma fusca]
MDRNLMFLVDELSKDTNDIILSLSQMCHLTPDGNLELPEVNNIRIENDKNLELLIVSRAGTFRLESFLTEEIADELLNP